jgi:hypothetical protein
MMNFDPSFPKSVLSPVNEDFSAMTKNTFILLIGVLVLGCFYLLKKSSEKNNYTLTLNVVVYEDLSNELTLKEELIKTMKLWKKLAKAKDIQAKSISPSEEVFNEHASMCKKIIDALGQKISYKTRIFVCRDKFDQQIQAVALCHSESALDQIKINYLVSHPNNARSPVNKGVPSVKGAGLLIVESIKHYAFTGITPFKEIHLNSIPSAVGFYKKKLGFKESNGFSIDNTCPLVFELKKSLFILWS